MSKGRFVIALTGDLFISYSDKIDCAQLSEGGS